MENRIPDSLSPSELRDKSRGQQYNTSQLDAEGGEDNEAGQSYDSAHLRRGDRLLHNASLHQTDLASGDKGQ